MHYVRDFRSASGRRHAAGYTAKGLTSRAKCMKHVVVSALAAAVISGITIALAQPNPPPEPGEGPWHIRSEDGTSIRVSVLQRGFESPWNLVFLPLFVLLMISVPLGLGLWFSALAIRYRDVKFALPFVISMLIYSAPIHP